MSSTEIRRPHRRKLIVTHNFGELSQARRVLERVVTVEQLATEQGVREKQYQDSERECGARPRCIPGCCDLCEPHGKASFVRNEIGPSQALRNQSYQHYSQDQQNRSNRTGAVSHCYLMLAGRDRNRAEVRIDAIYRRGLGVDASLLTREVGDP